MTQASRLTNQALLDVAGRLVEERRDLPPGSVLRCFSRAVRTALLRGYPPVQVPAEAERMTRELLGRRPSAQGSTRRRQARPGTVLVPRPRRAG